ncbi:hypothetical protein BC830DRAFT_1097840 [Chytriomyces sp. MP71]|nr:hypothetical protein BC830DRAFT_1097840 [Chytriomyces sp. MP71]
MMSDLNWCICGRATLEDAIYCSMICKKNDFASTALSSASPTAASEVEPSFSSLPSPITPLKPTPMPLTFTFHCSGTAFPTAKRATMARSFPSANKPDFSSDVVVVNGFLVKRPRMNSVDTPPASPVLKFAFNNVNCSAESCYAQLAFNSRKKRDG